MVICWSPKLLFWGAEPPQNHNNRESGSVPVAIFASAAAGPSGMTLLTCRNSSGSSPPMMVKPKPMLLFCSAVDRKLPFSWVGSRVNRGFSAKDTSKMNGGGGGYGGRAVLAGWGGGGGGLAQRTWV